MPKMFISVHIRDTNSLHGDTYTEKEGKETDRERETEREVSFASSHYSIGAKFLKCKLKVWCWHYCGAGALNNICTKGELFYPMER